MEPAAWEVFSPHQVFRWPPCPARAWRAEVFEVFPCSQLHAENFGAGKAFHVPSLRENKGNRAKYFFRQLRDLKFLIFFTGQLWRPKKKKRRKTGFPTSLNVLKKKFLETYA
jgi:hypothetical protein